MASLSVSRVILLQRDTPNILDWITMKALHLPSILLHFAISWLLLQLMTLNFTLLTLVMGTDNPRPKIYSPAPIPADTRTLEYGYGYPATTGAGSRQPHGLSVPYGFGIN